mgnify:CR=1 FL=1
MLLNEELEKNKKEKEKKEKQNLIFFKSVFFCMMFYILKSSGFEKMLDYLKNKLKVIKILSNNLIQIVLFGLIYFIIKYYIK